MKGNDYNITYPEVCLLLKKSKRTVSRYIKNGLLNSEKIGNQYLFNRNEVEKLNKTKRTKRTDKTKPERDIISFLKEQIKVKDEQIKEYQERSRETNIMFNRLQNQLLLTGDKKEVKQDKEDRQDKKEKGLNGFFKRLFK